MPETNLPDALLKIGLALAKHHIKNVIGDEALEVVANTLTDVGGEKVQAKVDSIFASKEGQKELLKAAKAADEIFKKECKDNDLRQLFSMEYGTLPSVQEAIAKLPEALDDETLRESLFIAFRNDAPRRINDEKVNEGVNLYVECLQSALIPVNDFGLGIIHNALKEIGKNIKQIKADVEMLLSETKNQSLRTQIIGEILYRKFADAPILSTYIYTAKFKALIDERTKNFVGREFIFKAIDDFLNDIKFPSGYIIISGEPGIGKTALLAQLVKQRGYVHHFNTVLQNIRSTDNFLANICAQLIVRYELKHSMLPPNATENSEFLSQLLSEVVEKGVDKPIVILVDALDEVGDVGRHQDINRLCLPPDLPDGVFFVVTKREEFDDRLSVGRRKDIYLKDDDPRNLKDVRQHIENFITEYRTDMILRIKEWDITEDEFLDTITERSEGNFMYLVYVLGDIRDGRLTAANIDNIHKLPQGLKDYYQRHWRGIRVVDPDRFDKYYEPVLCILATVREPVTIAHLIEWTELVPMRIHEVIEKWRQYLNKSETEQGEPLYRVYHTSFQDFLKEEVGLVKYEDKIAVTALRKIPGFLDGRDHE
jgi:hypothetical protein